MLYRKSSPRPPTLLLRIVATAGAGALLGAAAAGCSSEAMGSIAYVPDSGQDATGQDAVGPCNGGPCGSVVMPPDSGEAGPVDGGVVSNPDSGPDGQVSCDGGGCGVGVMPMPFDAGDAGVVGLVVNPDSGADARGPCGVGFCGSMIRPEGGSDQ